MAIIDSQVYKLDVYNDAVCKALYRCADGEKFCKAMQKYLVFYDAESIMDMRTARFPEKVVYDISKLQPLQYLGENETVERIVPLDDHWLGIFFKNKETNMVVDNKMMYVSADGDGYMCDELEPALNGYVAESVYLRHIEDNPTIYVRLHKKYFDGTHDEFLGRFYDKTRSVLTKMLVSIIQNRESKINSLELKSKEDLTLEEIRDAIIAEYHRKPHADDFDTYRALDMLYSFYDTDTVISLSNKYGLCDREKSEKKEQEKQ